VQHPKKPHTVRWVVLAVVALFIVASYATEDSPAEKATDQAESDVRIAEAQGDPIEAPEFDIPTELVVDVMGSEAINEFCVAYFNIGDYDLAVEAFSEGYTPVGPIR
jgi:hypothetical protein